jgi:hypothetical protein
MMQLQSCSWEWHQGEATGAHLAQGVSVVLKTTGPFLAMLGLPAMQHCMLASRTPISMMTGGVSQSSQ